MKLQKLVRKYAGLVWRLVKPQLSYRRLVGQWDQYAVLRICGLTIIVKQTHDLSPEKISFSMFGKALWIPLWGKQS